MLGQTQSFRCPSCNEYINTDAKECRFCSHPIDAEAAQRAADEQEKINRACNDALNIRNLAGAMWVMIVLRWVPFIGCFTEIGALFMFFATLALLIRWEVKYAAVRTSDPDFAAAKRNRLIALGLWIGALALFIVGIAIVVAAQLAGQQLR
jgi:hypothetical protein